MLTTDDPVRGLRILVDTGLMDRFLPEVPALRLVVDEHHHHKDVYEHSLTVLRQTIELDHARSPGPHPPFARLRAPLSHHLGKPATRRLHHGAGDPFHPHAAKGTRAARTGPHACRPPPTRTRPLPN